MKRIKPIKPFKTLEEEAKFWDTHDLSLVIKNPKTSLFQLPLLESEKKAILTIRIQKSIKELIEKIAKLQGINPTTLSRMWLIEKIREKYGTESRSRVR